MFEYTVAKAAGEDSFNLDVDDQHQLFAALRARSTKIDMALRKLGSVALVETDENETKAEAIDDGFRFGDKAETIHVVPHTEGAIVGVPLIVWAIAAAVVVSIATSMLMAHMNTNPNGAGGSKSTMFNGPVNSTDQGGPIPIVYGKRVLIGSTIIASDEDYVNIL